MRSNWWLIPAAFVVLAGFHRLSFSAAPKPARARPGVVAAAKPPGPEENVVDGYGPTAAAARDRALEHAQERVEKLLQQRFRLAGWKPSPEQLAPEYLVRYGVVQPQGEPKPSPDLRDEKALVARYKVELTRDYLREVQRVAREERVQERHLILARVLAGLVVLLLVTAGYLRLEDMTRGYATQLLRAVAVGLVALAAVGLWLTMP
jgi:hypothetical protein